MARRRRGYWWARLPYDELQDVRLCDLELTIEGTALEQRVERLRCELERAGLRFRPYVWLSTDWFTPNGSTGFAMPFYLAHPRLARIEHRWMFETEGGNHSWCMKLLRHETGHTLDHAYRLHHKKRWRETFGGVSQPYRSSYTAKPTSRRYVLNLDYWYSHSHPVEDWAETFAVWLQPGSRWRRTYAGWPALKKLRYVDEQMQEIADQAPPVRTRNRPESLSTMRNTLGEYYARRMSAYPGEDSSEYDPYLLRVFSADGSSHRRPTAASFLTRRRHELRSRISNLTGVYRYEVDQALKVMIARCRVLRLRLARSERETHMSAGILLAMLTTSVIKGRRREFWR